MYIVSDTFLNVSACLFLISAKVYPLTGIFIKLGLISRAYATQITCACWSKGKQLGYRQGLAEMGTKIKTLQKYD